MSLFDSSMPGQPTTVYHSIHPGTDFMAMRGSVAPSVIYTGSAGSSSSSSAGSSYTGSPLSSPRLSGRGTTMIPSFPQTQFPSSPRTIGDQATMNVAMDATSIVQEVMALPLGLLEAAAQIVSRVAHLGAEGLHHANQAFANAVKFRHGIPTVGVTAPLMPHHNMSIGTGMMPATSAFIAAPPLGTLADPGQMQYLMSLPVNSGTRQTANLPSIRSAAPSGMVSIGFPPSTNPFNNPPGTLGMPAPSMSSIAQQASLANQAFVASRPVSSNPSLLNLPAEFSFL